MGRYVTKPGVAQRATFAFALLNVPLIVTTAVVVWLAGSEPEWWVRGFIAVLFAGAEFAIVINTIAPPLMEWIEGKELVEEGKKPSWED